MLEELRGRASNPASGGGLPTGGVVFTQVSLGLHFSYMGKVSPELNSCAPSFTVTLKRVYQ